MVVLIQRLAMYVPESVMKGTLGVGCVKGEAMFGDVIISFIF